MPDLYAGSCNPARRVKQSSLAAPMPFTSPSVQQRSILPLPSPQADDDDDQTQADPAQSTPQQAQPAKRGRKPGPLSRSAREAQRKLNHSIIEKARRTKINDALATLRQLVPVNHGYSKNIPADDAVDPEEEDGSDNKSRKDKSKGASKKEEKEKEFKLEILVRTVSYMQELLERVTALEERANAGAHKCSKCGEYQQQQSSKRRKSVVETSDDKDDDTAHRKRSRRESINDQDLGSPRRLPSISSWLPNCDPTAAATTSSPLALSPTQRRPPGTNITATSPILSHLPSPPSSAHFNPVRTPQMPPVLNLGPVASRSTIRSDSISSSSSTSSSYSPSLISPLRTPEDESAASMLLQISSSSSTSGPAAHGSAPSHHHHHLQQQQHQHTNQPVERSSTSSDTPATASSSPSSSPFYHLSKLRTLCITPQTAPAPNAGTVEEYQHSRQRQIPQAQTPGSLLGLTRRGSSSTTS